jgi:type IV pilus assembly protein PilQ
MDLLRARGSANPGNNVNINYSQIRFEKVLADLERGNPGVNVELRADTFAEEQALLATPVSMGPLLGVTWDAAVRYVGDRMGLLVNRDQISDGVLYFEKVPRFTDSFDGVPLGEAVREISRRGNANVIFSPAVAIDTPVTLAFTDVPWRSALESLLKAHNCTILYDAESRIMRISTMEDADKQFETRSRPLRYVQPEGSHFQAEVVKEDHTEFVGRTGDATSEVGQSLIAVLENVKSPEGNVTYESRTNTLIIRDTPLKIQEILKIVDEIDVAPQQVLVETRMVTVEDNPDSKQGVRWGRGGKDGMAFNFNNNGAPNGAPSWDVDWPWSMTRVGDRFGVLSLTDLNFMIQMSQYDDRVNIVQAPQILVLDNEEASVFIGNVENYVLQRATESDNGRVTYSFDEREVLVGVQLLVIPHVVRGTDQVILEIIPKQTDQPDPRTVIAPDGSRMDFPGSMRVKTVHTKMMLHSTETGVIAGLFRDELKNQTSKVPGLNKIPVLGKAFQHESKQTIKQNTMILVTPTIVSPKHGEEFDRDVEELRESLASSLR